MSQRHTSAPHRSAVLQFALATLVLVATVGCEKRSSKAKPTAQPDQPTTPADNLGAGPAATPVPVIAESQISALIDAWVSTQNNGSFDDYAKLYAQGFRGVRRSGDKRVELPKDAWLRERARMFKRPMTVAIAERTIAIDGQRATVDFIQTWESGKYADRGPKRMVVEDVAGSLLITSEELLSSTRIAPSTAPLLAMYPDAEDRPSESDFECADLDQEGDLQICVAVTDRSGPSVSIDVGLVRRNGLTFQLLDTEIATYSVGSVYDFPGAGDDLGLSESADARLSGTVEIGKNKQAIEVTLTAESSIQDDGGNTARGQQVMLFTAIDNQLVPVLSLESTSTGDTDFDGKTERSYEVLSTVGDQGYFDISVTTESERNAWPVNETSSESDTTTLHWQEDSGYQ